MFAVDHDRLPKCEWTYQLTYLEGKCLKVNHTVLRGVCVGNRTHCDYRALRRRNNSDNGIVLTKKVSFDVDDTVEIHDEFIKISCYDMTRLCYRNYHVLVLDKESIPGKMKSRNGTKRWNVILIGTDSLSHSAAVRYLPQTMQYLSNNLHSIDMLGYTKVGLNTLPNMIPFLTGRRFDEIYEGGKVPLDYLPLIFQDYSKAGYLTFFGEDAPHMGLFNYLLPGFKHPPTDYYFRPLALAVSREKNMTQKECEKHVIMQRMLMDYLKQFVLRFQNYPFFALMYIIQPSHDSQAEARVLDQIYLELLKDLGAQGVWNNTILLFFSDHGARYGDIMDTRVGRIEAKLPMMSIAIPKTFKEKHPQAEQHLKINHGKLTTAFDSYHTLLDIVGRKRKFKVNRGMSLFSPVPINRTCFTAGIPMPFCVCYKLSKVSVTHPAVKQGALLLVDEINNILKDEEGLCENLQLDKIKAASAFRTHHNNGNRSLSVYYQIVFVTVPGFAEFQGTIHVKSTTNNDLIGNSTNKNLEFHTNIEGPIGRLNKYGHQSICVKQVLHRLYCYCKLRSQ